MLNEITKLRFDQLANNLLKESISEEYHASINHDVVISELFKSESQISYQDLLESIKKFTAPIQRAFVKRIVLVDYAIRKFDEKEEINTQFVWRLIFDSLLEFKKKDYNATVGSQGFLSVELYRLESTTLGVKILRLHVWHESLNKLFEKTQLNKYSVHSHLFNAQSQVLCGTIINKRFKINPLDNSNNSLYKIVWKDSGEGVNGYKRKSTLEESQSNIIADEIFTEELHTNQMYNISKDEFHSTESLNSTSPTATLFLFDSFKGRNEFSQVVGPKGDTDPGFKYEKVNVLPLLHQIDQQIKKHYNKPKLLALDWMRKMHTLEFAHRIESRQMKVFNEILAWTMMIIPAIVASLIIFVRYSEDKELKPWLVVTVAIGTFLITILGAINRVIQPGTLGEKHRLNSEGFEHLRHKLESHIIFHHDDSLETLLDEVRTDWKKMSLINVKECNFKKAKKIIDDLHKYPESSGFLEDYIP